MIQWDSFSLIIKKQEMLKHQTPRLENQASIIIILIIIIIIIIMLVN